ncbi:response regulator transcription factor [Sphingobacterium olei]|uniref:Response regulator transcription factor n=1 Tax=Sphingobacterium olei TaxID=2571155 RepID=A0A4U0P764_9SPHI|nr:LytTR family DNA-binding domain-containing protein [Sphingobacterium olei]TJZ63331.1 response regulator transcription factor [Sphingobacterium olei]
MKQKKIRVMVVDDEPEALKSVSEFVRKTKILHLVSSEKDPTAALHKIFRLNIDILLIDMEMPGLSGLDIFEQIKHLTLPSPGRRPLRVIASSAHREYAAETYRLRFTDYLVKPYSYSTFMDSINKVLESWDTSYVRPPQIDELFFVREAGSLVQQRIDFSEIVYLQADAMETWIWLDNDTKKIIRLGLGQIEASLPVETFKRCHKSFIVNVDYVRKVVGDSIALHHIKESIPYGATYKQKDFGLWVIHNSLV